MHWNIVKQTDARAVSLADKHYSRQKPGTPQFTPPGRKMILLSEESNALWVTSWPYAQYVNRAYPDAWICTLFRNESQVLSSILILEAVAITRYKYPDIPASGMITLVDASKIQSKNPGYCYKQAGFQFVGYTKKGLHILQMLPEYMPYPQVPNNWLL